ncbi:MAG: DUF3995 domain-containing protein [Chitinophagaceae bacterium]
MKTYSIKRSILTIAVIINTVIFILLSLLHFYWAFGGVNWLHEVLPTSSNGVNRMNPGMAATLIVAFGLLLLSIITAGNFGLFNRYFKRKYFSYGALLIAIIFFLRALGDFKFIGFFKTIKSTKFAINDTQIFSPLCLFVSLLSMVIFLFSRNIKY